MLLPVAPLVAAVPELGAGCGAGRLPSHGGRPHEPPAETVHLTVPSPCSSGDASDPPPLRAPCPARAAEALCGACAHLRAGGGGLAARRGAGRQGSGQLAQSHAKFKRGVWISQLRSGTPTAGSRLFSQRDGCAFPRQSAAPWLPPCGEGPCGQSPRTPSCPGWAGRGAGVVECYLYTCTLQSTLSVCLVCD